MLVGGERKRLTGNKSAILRALVLADGKLERVEVIRSLPKKERKDPDGLLDSEIGRINEAFGLKISSSGGIVALSPSDRFEVDLWNYIHLAERDRFQEASKLNPRDAELDVPEFLGFTNPRWEETLASFEAARKGVREWERSDTAANRLILAERDDVLAGVVSPGFGRQIPIRDVHGEITELPFRWRVLLPEERDFSAGSPLPRIAGLLEREPSRDRIILTGGSGMGKSLLARLCFLQLSPKPPVPAGSRVVLYLDAKNPEEGFGEDAWLEQRLRDRGASPDHAAIVIIAHADAFLASNQWNLPEVLNRSLFRDHDILLCCGTQLYRKGLRGQSFATEVIKLEPWTPEMQDEFAATMYDEEIRDMFAKWRDEDPWGSRQALCSVPLHLIHLLGFLDRHPEAFDGISKRCHLFDQLAIARLAREDTVVPNLEARYRELAGLAHHFYEAGERTDRRIGFTRFDMTAYLQRLDGDNVDARADELIEHTLLSPSESISEFHFEDVSWSWFLTAKHLRDTLVRPDAEERPLLAFSKFLSIDVMELCNEMLREAKQHRTQIVGSLRHALFSDSGKDLEPFPRAIAREQIAYLLGIIGGSSVHEELKRLLDPDDELFDRDPLVRRGAVIGLANSGHAQIADQYVDALRAERSGTSTEQRDANLAFLLSFHNAQSLDPDDAEIAVVQDVDPSPAVTDLVRQLEEQRHGGRIKLFTLVDLGEHPAISREAYERAIALEAPRLRRELARRRAQATTEQWPELDELEQVLGRCAAA